MAKIAYIQWKDADFKWNIGTPDSHLGNGEEAGKLYENYTGHPKYTWDEVLLVRQFTGAEDPEILWQDVNNLDKEKKKRFIKLICKVKGIETYSGQKTIREDIEISIEDIELVVKEVLGKSITVENIHV